MLQLLDWIWSLAPILVAALVLLLFLSFGVFFVIPSLWLLRKLKRFRALLRSLKQAGQVDPYGVEAADERLDHLWREYRSTLHRPDSAIELGTGIADPGKYRATVQAEAIFNAQAVFEGRVHTEFFKHLPGLLTGLGIIGTFAGLIHGLSIATPAPSAGAADVAQSLNTTLLIHCVEEAFKVSAFAIFLAMVVTFLEKVLLAGLHRKVEQLCQEIDELFASGVGEEYLGRLVRASEESAAQARILKDALVGELTAVLERLTENQITAAARQQEQLQHNLVATLQTGLMQPLETMAQGFQGFQGRQGEQLTQGLQDSMTAFADRLDQMLGGQVQQARELQAQTLQSLEKAAAAFQAMAQDVGRAGAAATSDMAAGIGGVLKEMVVRQGEINDAMRQLANELRAGMAQSQAESQAHLGRVVAELGLQVAGVVGQLRSEAQVSSAAHSDRIAEMSAHARASVDTLAEGVRAQTAAIEQVTAAVRAAVAELAGAVGRNVALMDEGAGHMREAAERFTASGQAMGEVLDRSREASGQLVQSAATLSSASDDVADIVGDYHAAREAFADLLEGLRGTVEAAKRDAATISAHVSQLEAAAQTLAAAQGEADEYLAKVTEVLAQAHGTFTSQMAETLRGANAEFHKQLADSTSLLASTIAELDGTVIEFAPRHRNGC